MARNKIVAGAREAARMVELYGPGTFGCHEALHMTSVLAEMVDERLCEHPTILLNHRWRRKAGQAAKLLFQLYQEIGAQHMPETPPHDR